MSIKNENFKKARNDFEMFVKIFGKKAEPAFILRPFDLININTIGYFQHPKQEYYSSIFLHAPPRAGKTLIATVLSALFNAFTNEKVNILICNANKTLSEQIQQDMRAILNAKEEILSIFGNGARTNKTLSRARKDFIAFHNGSSITFMTTDSKDPIGTGYHFVYLDDYISYSIMRSERKLLKANNMIDTLRGRIKHNPKTKFFFINQLLGSGDISLRIQQDYDIAGLRYMCLKYPYFFENTKQYKLYPPRQGFITYKQGDYLIPQYNKQTLQTVIAVLNRNMSRFYAEYMQTLKAGEYQVFNLDNLQRYDYADINEIAKKCDRFGITVDFAFSDKQNSDETVMCMWGLVNIDTDGVENKLYLLDANSGRWKTDLAISKLKEFSNKWQELLGSSKGILKIFEKEGNADKKAFGVVEFAQYISRQGISKIERARKAAIYCFNKKRVFFPHNLPHRPNEITKAITQMALLEEDKPMVGHDDYIDAITDGMNYTTLFKNREFQ